MPSLINNSPWGLLPPFPSAIDRYAVKDEKRVWPVQQYRPATGRDAFLKGLADLHEEEQKLSKGWIERKLAPKYDPVKEVRSAFYGAPYHPLTTQTRYLPWVGFVFLFVLKNKYRDTAPLCYQK